uniref:Uncharacterized protein n=1 Tax=Panagrolaimus sp. PS1159 TaxID=55785 RepID=A0AC35FDW4_9BILA
MIYKADFVQKTHLSLSSKTVINFGENFEFTIVLKKEAFGSLFCIENTKGDFEITKITSTNTSGEFPVTFNKTDKTLSKPFFLKDSENVIYTFYISANIQLKELCAVNYQFEIPVARCDIEVEIENPYDVEIEGKKGNFTFKHYGTKNIEMSLSFVFYPTILETVDSNK